MRDKNVFVSVNVVSFCSFVFLILFASIFAMHRDSRATLEVFPESQANLCLVSTAWPNKITCASQNLRFLQTASIRPVCLQAEQPFGRTRARSPFPPMHVDRLVLPTPAAAPGLAKASPAFVIPGHQKTAAAAAIDESGDLSMALSLCV